MRWGKTHLKMVMAMDEIILDHIHARARSSVGYLFEYLYPLLYPNRPIETGWYIHAMSEAIMSLWRDESQTYATNTEQIHSLRQRRVHKEGLPHFSMKVKISHKA